MLLFSFCLFDVCVLLVPAPLEFTLIRVPQSFIFNLAKSYNSSIVSLGPVNQGLPFLVWAMLYPALMKELVIIRYDWKCISSGKESVEGFEIHRSHPCPYLSKCPILFLKVQPLSHHCCSFNKRSGSAEHLIVSAILKTFTFMPWTCQIMSALYSHKIRKFKNTAVETFWFPSCALSWAINIFTYPLLSIYFLFLLEASAYATFLFNHHCVNSDKVPPTLHFPVACTLLTPLLTHPQVKC